MLKAPIPDDLAQSLRTGSPPPPRLTFDGDRVVEPEWIVGIKSDPAKGLLLSRLSRDVLGGHKIRIGWASPKPDGTYTFTPTSNGTCQIKDGANAPAGNSQ